MNINIFKSPWLLAGLAALAIFALSFLAINYVSQPDEEKGPEVKNEVIATLQSNPELIEIARKQGWIEASATEMTSVDASKVTDIATVFSGSAIKSFDEFRYFVGLLDIQQGAFAHAEALTSIVIPAYVQDIKAGAFAYCPSLKQLQVDSANTHYDSRGNCNAVICTWKGKLMLVAGCATSVIPADVRYLASQAFCGCTALKSVTFPERFEEIGEDAFRDCTSLESIELPQGMRFVEAGTFAGCTGLRSLTLSKSVERLRKDAFAGCSSLSTIVSPKRYPPIIENAFDVYNATVYVPKGMQNKYFTKAGWKTFKHYKEI